jgi:phospholipid/cholesterol/gamma-HCH transport system substrate-binding protein
LQAGAPVRVDGIVVGQVSTVALTGSSQPERVVRVQLEVPKDRISTITSDSYAQLAADSLIGDKLVDITSGSSAASIRDKAELPFKPAADMMKTLDLTQFATQLRAIDEMLTEIEQGKSAVGEFVLGEQMYSDLNRRIAEIEHAVHAAADTHSAVGKALYTDELYQKFRAPIVKLDQALAQIQEAQGGLGQLLRNPAQYESLRADVASLRKSVADVRAGAFIQSDQAYSDWVAMVSGWMRTVDEMNASPMLITSETYDNLNGMAREMRGTMKDFRENPQKFLRLKVF